MNQLLWEQVWDSSNLMRAWKRVKENQGAPGVDQITLAEFETNLDSNLTQLSQELKERTYKPLPVLRTYVDKENGTPRPIGIPTVRDRVVQETLALVLNPVFEPEFLDCSFAYRRGRSAVQAVATAETLIKNGCPWVLDGDIDRFFDTIDHALLLEFICRKIVERPLLNLVATFLESGVFEDMNLREEYLGIPQGSPLSPLLANIYLHPFDQRLSQQGYHLIRYADDFIIVESSQELIGRALADSAAILHDLKLDLSDRKTKVLHAREGFVFLGYYVDIKGKGPSRKAIDVISRKLAEISKTDGSRKLEDRIYELKQCLRGWSNYFRTCRGIEPADELIFLTLIEISLELNDEENARTLLERRHNFDVKDPELHYRLGHIAKALGMLDEAMDEFSRTLKLRPDHLQARQALNQLNLIDDDVYKSIGRLRRLIYVIPDSSQAYRDLASCYAEIGEYGLAKEAYDKAVTLELPEFPEGKPLPPPPPLLAEPSPLDFCDKHLSLFLSFFRGRNGVFARQWIDTEGRRGFSPQLHPLTAKDVKSHLAGEETLGIYLMTENNQVYLSVIDVDINQKALIQYAKDAIALNELYQLVHQRTVKLVSVCEDLKIPVLIEDSGYKGRHLWFFFTEAIPAKLARKLLKLICDQAGGFPASIHQEIFPTQDKIKGNGYGCLIKLPLGIHKRTNRRCLFLDRSGSPLPDQWLALSQVKTISLNEVETILLTYGTKPQASSAKPEPLSLVAKLLAGCKVVNYLVSKAGKTHYLNNAERVTLLYTLGQLGQEGKDFLHQVISQCINYDYGYTQKQIDRMKGNAISCARIKEKHEDIAIELGCDCDFKVPPKGYPSPILHAFSPQTIRLSKGMPQLTEDTKISRPTVPEIASEDINISLKKYIELRRQLRGIEKSLSRIEEQMSAHFDKLATDSLLTDYGVLVRERQNDKVNWLIQL